MKLEYYTNSSSQQVSARRTPGSVPGQLLELPRPTQPQEEVYSAAVLRLMPIPDSEALVQTIKLQPASARLPPVDPSLARPTTSKLLGLAPQIPVIACLVVATRTPLLPIMDSEAVLGQTMDLVGLEQPQHLRHQTQEQEGYLSLSTKRRITRQ